MISVTEESSRRSQRSKPPAKSGSYSTSVTRASPDSSSDESARSTRCPRAGFWLDYSQMRFEIVLAPEAVEDLRSLKASTKGAVRAALEEHLRHQPERVSRSRIKRLRGLSRPQYRLRVDEIRVFHDIDGGTVQVLAIVGKSEASQWLAQFGKPE